MNHQDLKHNIPLYYLSSTLGKPGFWIPILFVYLTDYKLFAIDQTLLAIGLVSLATTLSEIPTGVVADKFSRKISVAIGYTISAMAFILLLFINSFWSLVLLMIVRGIGQSFKSGADQALLYDTLTTLGHEDDYKKHLNIGRSYTYIQIGITTFLAGILATFNTSFPLIATAAFYILAALATLGMREPKRINQSNTKNKNTSPGIRNYIDILFSAKSLKSGLLLIFIFSSIVITIFKTNKNILTPIFDSLGSEVAFIGIAVSLIYIVKALGAFVASKFNKPGNESQEAILALIGYVLLLFLVSQVTNPLTVLILFLVLSAIETAINTNLNKLFNDYIPSDKRATLLSIKSVFTELVRFGFIAGFGLLLENSGLSSSIIYTAVILFISTIGLVINMFVKKKKDLLSMN